MLKGISPLISPPLMNALMEMGHGDELVFGDSNFPSVTRASKTIYCCGHRISELLTAILPLFPLDYAVEYCGILMQPTELYPLRPPVWEDYRNLFCREEHGQKEFLYLEKQEFYLRAEKAFAVVATGEASPFSNLIIRKGIVLS